MQKFFVNGKTVKFLAQAVVGNDRTKTSELSFAGHKSKYGDVEINWSNCEQPGAFRDSFGESRWYFRRGCPKTCTACRTLYL
jgi:hypothetical protein